MLGRLNVKAMQMAECKVCIQAGCVTVVGGIVNQHPKFIVSLH